MHELLKLLNEYNIDILNCDKIDTITMKIYEEILFQYLSDVDQSFDKFNFMKYVNDSEFYECNKIFILMDFNKIKIDYIDTCNKTKLIYKYSENISIYCESTIFGSTVNISNKIVFYRIFKNRLRYKNKFINKLIKFIDEDYQYITDFDNLYFIIILF